MNELQRKEEYVKLINSLELRVNMLNLAQAAYINGNDKLSIKLENEAKELKVTTYNELGKLFDVDSDKLYIFIHNAYGCEMSLDVTDFHILDNLKYLK